jgi:hypothetical protein
MQFKKLVSNRNRPSIVLYTMLGTMLVAGIWSFIIGSASLKGVNTLDMNLSKKINKNNTSLSTSPKEFAPYPEEKILKTVRVYIANQKENNQNKDNTNQAKK